MNAVCKMTGEATTWPCSAHGCPLYGDCLSEYAGNSKPMTNADRIRTMSDEELATMLFDYKECSKKCIMNNGKHCYEICEEESVILKWLQQPAEEEKL